MFMNPRTLARAAHAAAMVVGAGMAAAQEMPPVEPEAGTGMMSQDEMMPGMGGMMGMMKHLSAMMEQCEKDDGNNAVR